MKALDWRTLVKRLPERIWFRLVVYAVAALAMVGLAWIAGPLLPSALALDFGQDAALRILQILATSMLAVTTFSLTAMISAYAAAASGTTPRATQLLIADPTSQNALSTFLGTFVFSIVGVIVLSTESFTEEGRSLLYVGTLVVIAVVVGTLLRWIHHLTGFGRVTDVIDRVENAATRAIRASAREPHLGGAPPVAVPADTRSVSSDSVGSITGVNINRLQDIAEATDTTVHVVALPGAVHRPGYDAGAGGRRHARGRRGTGARSVPCGAAQDLRAGSAARTGGAGRDRVPRGVACDQRPGHSHRGAGRGAAGGDGVTVLRGGR